MEEGNSEDDDGRTDVYQWTVNDPGEEIWRVEPSDDEMHGAVTTSMPWQLMRTLSMRNCFRVINCAILIVPEQFIVLSERRRIND